MEFYVVVVIFITCMIILALLIYYCQEYRSNAKYSFTENQRDISAIALAIAAPAFNRSRYQPSSYQPPGIVTLMVPPQSSQPQAPSPGFVINGTQPENLYVPPYPTKQPQPPPPTQSLQGYSGASLIPDDEMSDSGSSSSSKIYFTPNTAAYSIAKRMSVAANVNAIEKRRSLQTSLPAQAAAYLLAKRMKEMQQRKESVNSENNQGTSMQNRSMSPAASESTNRSDRANSQESCSIDMKNRRSMSPYIPATVVAFHLKNKDSRSSSPYTPLRNDSPDFSVQNEKGRNNQSNNNNGVNPIPPKRIKKQTSMKQNENDCLEEKELAPPQRSENICYPKQTVFIKNVNEDRVPFVSKDAPYRSPSPVPLQSVEEEEE